MSADAHDEFVRKPDDDPDAAILPSRDLLLAQAAKYESSPDEEDENEGGERRVRQQQATRSSNSQIGNYNSYVFSASATNEALEKLRGKERFFERLTWIFAIVFMLCIAIAVIYSNESLYARAMAYIAQAQNAAFGPELNCKDPKLTKTPECRKKLERTEAEWRQIIRNQEGKATPFSFHGKE